jgi:hypothetical protein
MLQGEQHGTIGDLLPKFVYPSTVAELKRQIDPSVRTTDAAVDACTKLEPGERVAWKAWVVAWNAYLHDDNSGWLGFGSSNRYDEGIVFKGQLAEWQEQLRVKCTVPGPVVVADEKPDFAAIKWAAAAVIVVGVVYGVRTIVK